PPQILGHEMVGRVVAMHQPARHLTIGQRITWTINASCGDCERCENGYPQKCVRSFKYGHEQSQRLSGGFASHVVLRAGTGVVPVGNLPAEVIAPANCATATVAAAITGLQLANKTVLVSGAGMLGLTATAMATELGAKVTVSDINEERLEQAKLFGAVMTVNTAVDNINQ